MTAYKRSEDTEQIAVFSWAAWNQNKYPELRWMYHVPNGGSRNSLEAAKLKQMGVKPGVSDICLPFPRGVYAGLYIEMKYGKNKKTDNQIEFLEAMEKSGHFVVTCYSAECAIAVIKEYLELRENANDMARRKRMRFKNNIEIKDGELNESWGID